VGKEPVKYLADGCPCQIAGDTVEIRHAARLVYEARVGIPNATLGDLTGLGLLRRKGIKTVGLLARFNYRGGCEESPSLSSEGAGQSTNADWISRLHSVFLTTADCVDSDHTDSAILAFPCTATGSD
jgi:hypothetical protein